jgi:hypothetical protein
MKAARRRKRILRGGSWKEGILFRSHRRAKNPQLKDRWKEVSENRLAA